MTNKDYITITMIPLLPFLLFVASAAPSSSLLPSSPSPSPSPSAPPPNITKILEKADEFTRFIGLLKSTHIDDRLETQLDPTKTNNQQTGLTIFAPNDNAFSNLKSGIINSLSYDQITKLVLFHCVPSFLSFSDLQPIVNPLRTEAGDVGKGQYPLIVKAIGTQVNFSTGVARDETSVSSTIYSNSTQRLAIYEINRMLAPIAVFPISPFLEEALPPTQAPTPGPASEARPRNKNDDDNDGDGVASVVGGGGEGGVGGGSTSPRDIASGGESARMWYYHYHVVFGVLVMVVCL